jgi:large subunit ribosomal protein L23
MKTPFDIVKTVRVTEKGTVLSEKNNQYTLRVNPRANKHQIRNAVERLFNVKVTGVRTLNVSGKDRRKRTKQAGRTSDWKKAIVTLKQGDKIEVTA